MAVWNRTRAKAEAFAKRFSIPRVFDTPEELHDWGDFDIADIIVDAPAHEALTLLFSGWFLGAAIMPRLLTF